jgi:7-cyano-7-deazaguanine synthase in queuosine biosynthesis
VSATGPIRGAPASKLVPVYCNDYRPSRPVRGAHRLTYLSDHKGQRVTIGLPAFVQDLLHLPPRMLDLLEIAAYVFSADRLTSRGPKDSVEYHAWSRTIAMGIKVRDARFWNRREVKAALADALVFLTGDASWSFSFQSGHRTDPTSLFDVPGFDPPAQTGDSKVALFSGGIDSLVGALQLLESTQSKIVLVSHQSQPSTIKTQRTLVDALKRHFPGRCSHYAFECHLSHKRAAEETQRTRSFLYCSIAFAIAITYRQDVFYVFENGVTSINLYRREDLVNARASRTTHPQTIKKLAGLFSLISGEHFNIELPLLWNTKQEVVARLLGSTHPELLSSSVSCTRTFKNLGAATHCGECFQCLDRRLAVHGAKAEDYDHFGLYAHDIIKSPTANRETITTTVDYVRQASSLSKLNVDAFMAEYMSEMADLITYMPATGSDNAKIEMVWALLRRHGQDVDKALRHMRDKYDSPFESTPEASLLGIVASKEHLKPGPKRLLERIVSILTSALPEMFRSHKPLNEADLNEKLGALLRTHEPALRSEHPSSTFASARVVPDHSVELNDLLIEGKYIRSSTSPSKATEGIASDLTKYPREAHILFVVYDPDRAVHNDA